MPLFPKALLSWYRRHHRDLPWRRTKDPYRIWVSEIMLQQTTVGAVIPYYQRFLRRFPTPSSLAAASEEEVLTHWSGLGYYSRARNLHKAAKLLVSAARGLSKPTATRVARRYAGSRAPSRPSCHHKHGDDGLREVALFSPAPPLLMPRTVSGLMELPGIGRTTAGAIASIAFGVRAPVVDGNVIRVLSRLFCLPQNPKSAKGQAVFWKKAEEILPRKGCGDFNQALMELGATVCLPKPLCPHCPLRTVCDARRRGNPESYPMGKKRIVYREVRMAAAIVSEKGKVLMVRRPDKGLLRGMWEVPMVEGGRERLTGKWPLEVLQTLPTVRHAILNRRIKVSPFVCRLVGNPPNPYRWIPLSQVERLPASSMNRKILLATFPGLPSNHWG